MLILTAEELFDAFTAYFTTLLTRDVDKMMACWVPDPFVQIGTARNEIGFGDKGIRANIQKNIQELDSIKDH